jgi:hypothetical protein
MILEDLLVFGFMVAGAGVFLWYVFFRGGAKSLFKPFVAQPLKKTLKDELDAKLKMHGEDGGGYDLYLGNNKFAKVNKWIEVDWSDFKAKFKETNKNIYIDETKTEGYRLILFKCFSSSIILRFLGMGAQFYVIQATDQNDTKTYHIDHDSRKFIFPKYMDLVTYGNVWVNSDFSRDYLQNISIKRMLEQTQMYLENFPDKSVHLENETARIERIKKTQVDLEKGKYEESKLTGDTKIQ